MSSPRGERLSAHPNEAPVARNASDTMQKFKPQTPALRKLVDTLGSDSLNSKALRGTAAGQATLRKAQAQLSVPAGPDRGMTAWERFSAPLPPEKLIRQQLMIAKGSRPGKFKYNGVATLGLELPSGPISGYKAAREGSKDTSHDRADRLGRSTTEANLTGGWAAWDADSPPRARAKSSGAPPRTERRRAWASASAPGLSPSRASCHASASAPGFRPSGFRPSGRPSSAAGPAGGASSSACGPGHLPGHLDGTAAGRASRPTSAQMSASAQTSQRLGPHAEGEARLAGSGGQGVGQGAGQGLLRRLRFDAASGFEYDVKGRQPNPNPNPARTQPEP